MKKFLYPEWVNPTETITGRALENGRHVTKEVNRYQPTREPGLLFDLKRKCVVHPLKEENIPDQPDRWWEGESSRFVENSDAMSVIDPL